MDEERADPITDYRDLRVWKEAMALAADIYLVTRGFPRDELFGMVSQMRRAAASVPANIAEGFGREQTRPFVHSLRVAQGSLKELETHVLLAERVNLLPAQDAATLGRKCETVGKMLRALIRSLMKRADGF
ncbi:four helix bundle protein [Propylenella binzhouense]|uniref:Four helix bundle protein n=1 Tax=Propylenella binzhouense TaxID=2555902 RepID=A0A964WTA9_9HYPH|nr:four helix bundle protein [Propylenella binzhouense]MYZ47808.1 four helix bundle protein [Propylenella binzhouense]